jgi:hypothetical protein
MPHETNGSLPPLQATADRRCPSCRAVKPPDRPPHSTPARRLLHRLPAPQRRGRPPRHRKRALRQVARRAEAGHRALLARPALRGGSGDAA